MQNCNSECLHLGTQGSPTLPLRNTKSPVNPWWPIILSRLIQTTCVILLSWWFAPKVETAAPRLCPVHRMRSGFCPSVSSCGSAGAAEGHHQTENGCSKTQPVQAASCMQLGMHGVHCHTAFTRQHLDVGGQCLGCGVVVRGDAGELLQEASVCLGARKCLWQELNLHQHLRTAHVCQHVTYYSSRWHRWVDDLSWNTPLHTSAPAPAVRQDTHDSALGYQPCGRGS